MVATPEIEVRHLPAQTIAYRAYRGTLASIESETTAIRSWAATMGYQPRGPLALEIEGDPSGDASSEYDIEIHLPLSDDATAAPSDQFQIKRFEPTDAAVMTLHGPFQLAHLSEPLDQMRSWLRARSAEPTTVVRWVEVTDPTKVSPDEQVTEVQHLLRRGSLPITSLPGGKDTMSTTSDGPARPAADARAASGAPANSYAAPDPREEPSLPTRSRETASPTGVPSGMVTPPETRQMMPDSRAQSNGSSTAAASTREHRSANATVAPETRRMTEAWDTDRSNSSASFPAFRPQDNPDGERGGGWTGSGWVRGGLAAGLLTATAVGLWLYRRSRSRRPGWRDPERWREVAAEQPARLRQVVSEQPARLLHALHDVR